LSWTDIDVAQSGSKTHSGLIASFGPHVVKTGKLPAEFGRSLNRVQELRLTADYLAEPVSVDRAHGRLRKPIAS
jgi:uncharacterized protein (UPF0332 family)